jgi:hypothetical protein
MPGARPRDLKHGVGSIVALLFTGVSNSTPFVPSTAVDGASASSRIWYPPSGPAPIVEAGRYMV